MCPINNSEHPGINRGVELLLRKRREKESPKIKQNVFNFCKTISLLKREISIDLRFSISEKQ